MTDQRWGAIALVASALAGLATMAMHPTGHEFSHGGVPDVGVEIRNTFVHTLALAAAPVGFLGALVLALQLTRPGDRLAIAALAAYGLAEVGVAIAATASGYMAPGLLRKIASSSGAEATLWNAVGAYNGLLNQAFAKVYVLASGAAVLMWSIAMLRGRQFPRPLGVFGALIGAVLVVAMAANRIRLDVHGFGAVVLAEAIWFVVTGAVLWGLPPPTRRASSDLPPA